METRPEVEIEYLMRPETNPVSYYFNIYVRSLTRPEKLYVSQIERGADERTEIGLAAGAMAEMFGERYNEDRHPDSAAQAAMRIYDRLNQLNPIPRWDAERPKGT